MAITTLGANDSGSTSRTVINDNFTDLDTTKADLASPTFTGTPVLPTGTTGVTQSASDNSTKLATTAYVDNIVGDVSCRVYATGDTASNGSNVAVAFGAESFDTHGFHDNSTNNTRLTIPTGKGGKYMIGGSINTINSNSGVMTIVVDGTTTIAWNSLEGYSSTDNGGTVSTIYDLTAGQYVELKYQHSHSLVAGTGTTFWLYKIN